MTFLANTAFSTAPRIFALVSICVLLVGFIEQVPA